MIPTYRFDAGLVFPEIPHLVQSTYEGTKRAAAALTLAVAYLLTGNKFVGNMSTLTPKEIYDELSKAGIEYGFPVDMLFRWADSIMLDPAVTLEDPHVVPRQVGSITLHEYQWRKAAWAARRLGVILAMGCGVGKTATAVAAAIGAAHAGMCQRTRCYIVAPLNALGAWDDYISDLKGVFGEVLVYSGDSLHHLAGIPIDLGGAIIFDESHRNKNENSNRTQHAHSLRSRFEWGICLTGSMFHGGCDATMSLLDLACPGLARFIDVWDFGEHFHSIIVKKIVIRGREQTRRDLGIPAHCAFEPFVHYLTRGVVSLQFDSPEVQSVVQVPDQDLITVDSWSKPAWLLADEDTYRKEHGKEADLPWLWSPNTDDMAFMGAMAFANMEENNERLVERANELFGWSYTVDEKSVVRTRIVQMHQNDPTNEDLCQLIKLCGMPTIASLLWDMRIEGAIDRVPEKVDVTDADSGLKRITWRWKHPPGHSWRNPAPGPKLRWLGDWLTGNPDESCLVGCAAVRTFQATAAMLEHCGVSYHGIRGGTPAKDRKRFVKDFQANTVRVMLVQQVAGSESITLTRAKTSVLIDNVPWPAIYDQYLARTRRIGQKRRTTHYDLCFSVWQLMRLQFLRDGKAFDTSVRTELETAFTNLLPELESRWKE